MTRITRTCEANCRRHQDRTRCNWRKQLGLEIPNEYFSNFRDNKNHYLALQHMEPELIKMVLTQFDTMNRLSAENVKET